MNRYRKRPVEIEAQQLTTGNALNLSAWCGGTVLWNTHGVAVAVVISTIEGPMRADIGWWIIRGVEGEFYPCKPSVFDATYEPIEDTP